MSLNELRKQIDDLDTQIISLLSQRLQLVKMVGLYKLNHVCSIRDKGREEEILVRIRNLAAEYKLNPQIIERIFKILFRYYSSEQAKLWPPKTTRAVK